MSINHVARLAGMVAAVAIASAVPAAAQQRTVLTGPATFVVGGPGIDAQVAQVLRTVDSAGYQVTIEVQIGVQDAITIAQPLVGGGQLVLTSHDGAGTLEGGTGVALTVANHASVRLERIWLKANQSVPGSVVLLAGNYAQVKIGPGVTMEGAGLAHIYAHTYASVAATSRYSVRGPASAHILASGFATVQVLAGARFDGVSIGTVVQASSSRVVWQGTSTGPLSTWSRCSLDHLSVLLQLSPVPGQGECLARSGSVVE